ncbi:hypothetical protein [Methyloglobulus sp.]|uniref:hypothetical protein n=1 Tax=Methyloglobulus sp. TaxID=2518622 RepID=UPI0032B87161
MRQFKAPGSISESTLDKSSSIHRPVLGKKLTKRSEPVFTASGERYGNVAFPDDKTRTGRLNATDKQKPHRKLNRRVASQPHKL